MVQDEYNSDGTASAAELRARHTHYITDSCIVPLSTGRGEEAPQQHRCFLKRSCLRLNFYDDVIQPFFLNAYNCSATAALPAMLCLLLLCVCHCNICIHSGLKWPRARLRYQIPLRTSSGPSGWESQWLIGSVCHCATAPARAPLPRECYASVSIVVSELWLRAGGWGMQFRTCVGEQPKRGQLVPEKTFQISPCVQSGAVTLPMESGLLIAQS